MDLAGARRRAPLPWPHRFRPPCAEIARALASLSLVDAWRSPSLCFHGWLRHIAVVPPRRAAMSAATMRSSVERLSQVGQGVQEVVGVMPCRCQQRVAPLLCFRSFTGGADCPVGPSRQ